MAPPAEGGTPKSKSKARRSNSNARRRKVEADLRARKIHNKDVFALQQRLLLPGAGNALMDAARGLLQGEDYRAVVEERALEMLCGFPPCTHPSVGSGDVKKNWSMDLCRGEVCSTKDVGHFCSLECMRASGAFELRLEPEPAYVRPAAAVAASRGAVAEADASAEEKCQSATATEGTSGLQGKRPLPKIRQKAVVRFSRSDQTYTVQYDEYDGGGALPGVDSRADPPRVGHKDIVSKKGDHDGVRRMLNAQVEERHAEQNLSAPLATETAVASKGSEASDENQCSNEPAVVMERPEPSCSTDQGASSASVGDNVDSAAREDTVDEAGPGNTSPGDAEGLSEADDDEQGFFDGDFIDITAHERCVSGFVRAWGVLTSWLTEPAQRTIHRGVSPEISPQDERPDFAARRALLNEVLTQRVPGDLAALAPRLSEVVSSLGIHQALPPVSDVDLYDLLGSLLLRVLLQAEVARGSCSESTATSGMKLLTQKVKQAARNLGITTGELAAIEAHLDDQGCRGYVPIRSAA